MARLNWVKSHMLAAAVASAATFAGSFALADDVSQERLLNADKEAGNWLHHHKNYSATAVLVADRHQQGQRQESEGRLDHASRRRRGRWNLVAWRIGRNADRRERIHRTSPMAGARSTRSMPMAAKACWSGRWIPRPIMTGPARSPAAASTIAASRCGTTSSSRTRSTAAWSPPTRRPGRSPGSVRSQIPTRAR